MLAIRDLHVYYGGIHALNGISLDVPDGQIVSLNRRKRRRQVYDT